MLVLMIQNFAQAILQSSFGVNQNKNLLLEATETLTVYYLRLSD